MMDTMRATKPKPERETRAVWREVEVRALGEAAARLSLEALRLSRQAAELVRETHKHEAA